MNISFEHCYFIEHFYTIYSDGTQSPAHGLQSSETRSYSFNLEEIGSDARLVGVALRSGSLVDQITFIFTSSLLPFGMFGPYGGSGGTSGVTFAPEIKGFYGRSADAIDQIGFLGGLYE